MFFSSPRNSLEAHLSLLEALECNIFLTSETQSPLVETILSKRPMRSLVLPNLDHWLQQSDTPVYPYKKTMAEAFHDPFVALHSSGSTGLPKPIVMKQGTIVTHDAFQMLPLLGQKPWHGQEWKGKRAFLSFPLFHAAGICFLLPISIYNGITVVLPPSGIPITADVASSIHAYGRVNVGVFPPSMLVDISKDPACFENLQYLEHVSYGGGSLPQETGDLISTKTRISTVFGTTEAGYLPTEPPEPEDWQYLNYNFYLGQEFRHLGGDLYEHVLVRTKDPKLSVFQGIFATFPHLQEYSTKDLYSKHPTKSGLWLYRGRTDDVIVYSNGEKLNPLKIENAIEAHPKVVSALVYGQGKFQSALLVEPIAAPATKEARDSLIDDIWPTIARANGQIPAHGRIAKDFVLFTTSGKPMSRAGKGTVQRKTTLDSYSEEFDQLYTTAARLANHDDIPRFPQTSGFSVLCNDLLALIQSTTGLEGLTLTRNLFDLGLDSLKVLNLVRQINRLQIGRGEDHLISSKTIYRNPSVHDLGIVLSEVDSPGKLESTEEHSEKMQKCLRQYASDPPFNIRIPAKSSEEPHVVLLTGSTGSLGSYLLGLLLQDSTVSKVYCLNRTDDAEDRQRQFLTERDLSITFSQNRVEFLQYDTSKPRLGIKPIVYIRLLQDVTHVIHNAWDVNFNLPLSNFAPQLYGVRQLIDFSSLSAKGAFIFFISSISTVMNWGACNVRRGKVPEDVHDSWDLPEHMGYAESKFVAERLLAKAQEEVQVPAAICRVGQIAGSTTGFGMWSKQEWIPSILASSKYLGKIPDSLGTMDTVDWVPVDKTAQIILDLVKRHVAGTKVHPDAIRPYGENGMANGFDQDNKSYDADVNIPEVYHIVNPFTSKWSTLAPTIRKHLGAPDQPLEAVPLASWISALRDSSVDMSSEDITLRNPAVKIMDYLESIQQQMENGSQWAGLATEKTLSASATMRDLEPVSAEWMEMWLRQWEF